MPKKTFFNLPETKKNQITSVAIDEFSENNYDTASINNIVEKSGIAKGSFYQYFEDKKDLYKYILRLSGEKKMEYFSSELRKPESTDFFTLIEELFLSGLKFANENQRLMQIANRFLADKSHPVYKEILKENKDNSLLFYKSLLQNAIAKNEVRNDVSIDHMAFMMSVINSSIGEYFFEAYGTMSNDKILDTIRQMLQILKSGIGTTDNPAKTGKR